MKIVQLPHARFTRDKEHLKTSLKISLVEALTGFSKEIPHLDHHHVDVVRNPGEVTQHGEIIRIPDEGMPKYGMPSDFGDMFVTFSVESPKTLNEVQQQRLKDLFKSINQKM